MKSTISLTPSQLSVSYNTLLNRAQSGHHAAPYQSSLTRSAAWALLSVVKASMKLALIFLNMMVCSVGKFSPVATYQPNTPLELSLARARPELSSDPVVVPEDDWSIWVVRRIVEENTRRRAS